MKAQRCVLSGNAFASKGEGRQVRGVHVRA